MTDTEFFAQFENMRKYDYEDAVLDSVKETLDNDVEHFSGKDIDNIIDELADDDSVTGNASGSFYCSRWKAEACLFLNYFLMRDALEALEVSLDNKREPEEIDVLIRYYVLTTGARDKVEELIENWLEEHEESEE